MYKKYMIFLLVGVFADSFSDQASMAQAKEHHAKTVDDLYENFLKVVLGNVSLSDEQQEMFKNNLQANEEIRSYFEMMAFAQELDSSTELNQEYLKHLRSVIANMGWIGISVSSFQSFLSLLKGVRNLIGTFTGDKNGGWKTRGIFITGALGAALMAWFKAKFAMAVKQYADTVEEVQEHEGHKERLAAAMKVKTIAFQKALAAELQRVRELKKQEDPSLNLDNL